MAPIIALCEYMRRTHDAPFLHTHRDAVDLLRERLLARLDPTTGLYSTLQDSQDEFQKLPFITYDNVLAWHAWRDIAEMYDAVGATKLSSTATQRADALKQAIFAHCVRTGAPGASGSIFASAVDASGNAVFTDIPPGSLFKLPLLGFVAEDDPVFARTYDWLHSRDYQYSYAGAPYG